MSTKEVYIELEIEVISFDGDDDIIVTSPGNEQGDDF